MTIAEIPVQHIVADLRCINHVWGCEQTLREVDTKQAVKQQRHNGNNLPVYLHN